MRLQSLILREASFNKVTAWASRKESIRTYTLGLYHITVRTTAHNRCLEYIRIKRACWDKHSITDKRYVHHIPSMEDGKVDVVLSCVTLWLAVKRVCVVIKFYTVYMSYRYVFVYIVTEAKVSSSMRYKKTGAHIIAISSMVMQDPYCPSCDKIYCQPLTLPNRDENAHNLLN